jgi:hypothetical protein
MRRRLLALAMLLLAALVAAAADRELLELLEELDATCEWDPLREAGVILAGSDRIAFQVGTPFVLLNYTERLDIPAPRREDGRILFDASAVQAVTTAVERMRTARPEIGLRIGAIPATGERTPAASAGEPWTGRRCRCRRRTWSCSWR